MQAFFFASTNQKYEKVSFFSFHIPSFLDENFNKIEYAKPSSKLIIYVSYYDAVYFFGI